MCRLHTARNIINDIQLSKWYKTINDKNAGSSRVLFLLRLLCNVNEEITLHPFSSGWMSYAYNKLKFQCILLCI